MSCSTEVIASCKRTDMLARHLNRFQCWSVCLTFFTMKSHFCAFGVTLTPRAYKNTLLYTMILLSFFSALATFLIMCEVCLFLLLRCLFFAFTPCVFVVTEKISHLNNQTICLFQRKFVVIFL